MIEVNNPLKPYQWAGVPFRHRYSSNVKASLELVQALIKYDSWLDLKFYLPTEKWHLVRYTSPDRFGPFVRVWELDDKPELGLQKEPGWWLLDAIKAGDTWGAAEKRVEEVDQINEAVRASNEREAEAQAKDCAEEMRKPLQKLFDEGPNADCNKFF